MAPIAVLTFHDGKIEIPDELQRAWKLREGSELRVVSSTPARILLETNEQAQERAVADWQSLEGCLPDLRTPEWQAQAQARKDVAREELDRVYRSPDSSATDIKRAEREWELADDELDFGPLAQR